MAVFITSIKTLSCLSTSSVNEIIAYNMLAELTIGCRLGYFIFSHCLKFVISTLACNIMCVQYDVGSVLYQNI